jgi:two-component system CheB/CheR fusion protein
VVGIGASAGGLEAFVELLRALPATTGMAFVLVQHLEPNYASQLAEILSHSTEMPVVNAEDGKQVEANHVYVIPPNTMMTIETACCV